MEDQFTLEEWARTEKLPFSITYEQQEQLDKAASEFHRLAMEYKIPYVLHYVEASDSDTFGVVTSSCLIPVNRVPAEILVCYTTGMYGVDDGIRLAINFASTEN